MAELFDQMGAWYARDPQRILFYLLGAVFILVIALLIQQWRQGRALSRRLIQMQTDARSVQEAAASSLENLHRQSLDVSQRGLQSLQSLLGERIGNLEREMLKDAATTRMSLFERFEQHKQAVVEALSDARLQQQRAAAELGQILQVSLATHRETFEKVQREAISAQQETLVSTLTGISRQMQESFRESTEQLGKRVEVLTRTTDERLKEITGQVEKRLAQGFEKTTETFTRVLEHLSRIDEAQKKITELSGNVLSLQEVLTDKRSRGAFGEVQLTAIVGNVMPEGSYQEQATLSNGRRVDCLLSLPDPTGNVPIDAKFPLESYQRMTDFDLSDAERTAAAASFRRDIRKHIGDIASKYIIPGETADGAVMFIPAEAVFAEIHAHFPEIVAEAQRAKVWMVSPTTLMAVLTTARAVIKDDATRREVHVIQGHLRKLAEDFRRFQQRMDKLATHIRQAKDDTDLVYTSSEKISKRLQQIEEVDVELFTDAAPKNPRLGAD